MDDTTPKRQTRLFPQDQDVLRRHQEDITESTIENAEQLSSRSMEVEKQIRHVNRTRKDIGFFEF